MTPEQIKNLIQAEIQNYSSQNQFSLATTSFHKHTGADSLVVPAQFLDYTNFMIWGLVSTSGGTATVKNPLIGSTTVVLATPEFSGSTITAAVTADGTVTFGSSVATNIINYLIIF